MRKKLVLICALTLLLATGIVTANAQQPHQNVAITVGEITEIYGNRVKVTGQGAYSEIILNISDSTHLLNGEKGFYITKESLEVGQKVTVYYSSITTRSMPPQSNAFAILVGDNLENGIYMQVSTVEQKNGIRILNSNQDQFVTFPERATAYVGKIKPGTELLTWYKMSTLSFPGQANSSEVLLLNNDAKVKVHLQSGVIFVNNRQIKEEYIKENGTIMLPLHSTAKALGYEVSKHPIREAYILQKGDFTSSVNLSAIHPSYVKNGLVMRLSEPPVVKDCVMFVPIDYFTRVLGETVKVLDSNV